MTEQDNLTAIEATFDKLDSLRPRFANAEPPAPGSALAADDTASPRMPLTELARGCLATAWDHFTCLQLTVQARRGYVSATGSVARGALVASAQALWLLHPDDPATRRERGLMLAQEWYYRRRQYQRQLTDILTDPEAVERSERQLAMLEDDHAAVTAARTTAAQLNVTNIIRDAATARFANARLTTHALLEWNRLGGDAHAIGWQLMLQSVNWTGNGPDALSTAAVLPTIGNIAEPYLAAWHMFGAALDRFDELSTAPTDSPT